MGFEPEEVVDHLYNNWVEESYFFDGILVLEESRAGFPGRNRYTIPFYAMDETQFGVRDMEDRDMEETGKIWGFELELHEEKEEIYEKGRETKTEKRVRAKCLDEEKFKMCTIESENSNYGCSINKTAFIKGRNKFWRTDYSITSGYHDANVVQNFGDFEEADLTERETEFFMSQSTPSDKDYDTVNYLARGENLPSNFKETI